MSCFIFACLIFFVLCLWMHVFLIETSLYLHNDSHAIITLHIVNNIFHPKVVFAKCISKACTEQMSSPLQCFLDKHCDMLIHKASMSNPEGNLKVWRLKYI